MNNSIMLAYDKETNNFLLNLSNYALTDLVRQLPNRRYSRPKECWIAPAIRLNALTLIELNTKYNNIFSMDEATKDRLKDIVEDKEIKHDTVFNPDYKYRTEPYEHQVTALDRACEKKAFALFMDMGTGKTKVAIDLVSNGYQEGIIDSAIVLCPGSIRRNWAREIDTHSPIDCESNVFESNVNDFSCVKEKGMQWFIFSIESLSQKKLAGRFYEYAKHILTSYDKTCLIIDEAHMIKTHKSVRTINAIDLGKRALTRLAMTGTPITQGPMDLYSIFEFLDPDIIGAGSFYSFRNRYAVMGGYEGKQIMSYQNLDELAEIVGPYSYQVKKSECLDLPEKIYERRDIELSADQMKIYKVLQKEYVYVFEDESPAIVCENVLTAYLKLQQIVSGFVITDTDGKHNCKNIVPTSRNPKLKEVLDIVEQNPDRSIIIWCKFIWEIHEISTLLTEKFGPVSMFYGGLNSKEKEESLKGFQEKQTRFFVASQQIGGVGLTLNVSDLVIYYSNTFKSTDRSQSEDRCHRIGQYKSVTYIDLIATSTIDEHILKALKNKEDLSSHVMGLLRACPQMSDKIESLF